MITIQVSGSGMFGKFLAGKLPQIQKSFERSSERIVDRMINLAREEYLKHRKTTKWPSNIISSFHYMKAKSTSTEVVGYFLAGGSDAPYIIYVEKYGWHTKNGPKEGYHFMEFSAKQVQPEVDSIVKEEFLKAFGG